MKQGKHLSMIRSFHLADWFTLGNAACDVGAIFAVMSYLQSQDVLACGINGYDHRTLSQTLSNFGRHRFILSKR